MLHELPPGSRPFHDDIMQKPQSF